MKTSSVCLEELERLIAPETEEKLYSEWVGFHEGKFTGDVFRPSRREKAKDIKFEIPRISINQTLADIETMTVNEFCTCLKHLREGDGFILCAGANYGTAILPSLFGAEIFYMDEELNTMPISLPSDNPGDSAKKMLDAGVPDLNSGLGGRVFDTGGYIREKLEKYPKVKKNTRIYHPDLQGPLDVCELLWGSGFFLDLFDQPELIKDFLALITQTYIKFIKKWHEIFPVKRDGYGIYWGTLYRGTVIIRNDSAMNLSPEMYREFGRPYDSEIYDQLGGGMMHFCGKGDHYIDQATDIEKLYTVDMSQPAYNDMRKILEHTVNRGINLIGIPEHRIDELLEAGLDFKGRVHCKWRPGADNVHKEEAD